MKEGLGYQIVENVKKALDMLVCGKIYTNANAHQLENDMVAILKVLEETCGMLRFFIENDYTIQYCRHGKGEV